MDKNGGSLRRKRGRPASTGNSTTNGSAAKKRKVEDDSVATPAANGASGGRGGVRKKSFLETLSAAISLTRAGKEVTGEDNVAKAATVPARRSRPPRATILGEQGKSVYDFPGSDGEGTVTTPSKKGRNSLAAPQNGTGTPKKREGRRNSAATEAMDVDENEPEDTTSNGDAYGLMQLDEPPTTPTAKKKRGPGRPPGSKNKKKTLDPPDLVITPRRGLQSKSRVESPTKVGRTPLKGILTPSRKAGDDTPRRRKSVAFGLDNGVKDVEIFFEDLPAKKAEMPQKPVGKAAAEESERPLETGEREEEEEDEEVCEICLKPDSKPPNEIIFCDNCDLGFHQKCHNVPVIPEGDWICKNCSQDDISKTPQKSTSAVVPVPSDAPDIPNLNKHLPALQRILVDRCTGQRRLKLTGLDEAYSKVSQLVEQTISVGEGNSMLLIGGRGLGKTTVGLKLSQIRFPPSKTITRC